MSRYLRLRQPGASVFFTVAPADRSKDTLVAEIGALRDAVRATMDERPFRIDVWVVLPDHLHAVWTLPEGDADYSLRWRLIKARFSRGLPAGQSVWPAISIGARSDSQAWVSAVAAVARIENAIDKPILTLHLRTNCIAKGAQLGGMPGSENIPDLCRTHDTRTKTPEVSPGRSVRLGVGIRTPI